MTQKHFLAALTVSSGKQVHDDLTYSVAVFLSLGIVEQRAEDI